MTQSLKYNQVNGNDSSLKLEFSGNIDENSSFPPPETLYTKNLILDLNDVQMINSLGVRAWTRWMKSLPTKVITLKNCTPPIVQQINIVAGFLPQTATIESFFVPYYCESCDTESILLMTKNVDFTPKTTEADTMIKIKNSVPCNNCNEDREIDALKDKYFAFLDRTGNQ